MDPVRPDFIFRFWVGGLIRGTQEEALEFWTKTDQLAPAFAYRGMTEYYLAKGDRRRLRSSLRSWRSSIPVPILVSLGWEGSSRGDGG